MSKLVLFALPRKPISLGIKTLASLVWLCWIALPAAAETLIGPVDRVRDVDTLVVNSTPIRLNGVDGPEMDTPEGRAARRWMISYLSGKTLRCVLNGRRSHDRHIGLCYVGSYDIGAAAIAAGHALDCRRFSNGRYANLETNAARRQLTRAGYC